MATPDLFLSLGHTLTKHDLSYSEIVGNRRFRSFFGTSPLVCSIVWAHLEDKPQGFKPLHLLWGLTFLKRYDIESGNRALMGCDEKTLRKWIWTAIELIANLKIVSKCYLSSLLL
jgi:hypothetical protein